MNNLKDILPDKLKQGLTPAEEELLAVATEGKEKDYSTGDGEADNPEKAESWGPERTLRAELLYWLCTDAKAAEIIHAKGIRIKSAKIDGNLDFEAASLSHPLEMIRCAIGDISFNGAETKKLNFSESHIDLFSAENLTVRGDVLLIKVAVKGEVRLPRADIGGSLECSGATFENPDGDAFNADEFSVKGSVFLRDVKAQGVVRLLGANISGGLSCSGATFENPEGKAFSADGLTAKGSVFLGGVKAKGKVRLPGVNIGGILSCTGATFENPEGKAFSADGLTAKGSVFLGGVKAKGEVHLLGANISGILECIGATFENPEGKAFNAENITVKGSVFLRKGFQAKGEVRLPGANIGGDLECIGATFENPDGDAFNADGFSVKGSVFLRDVKAQGVVRLLGANISGGLSCSGATFENPEGKAFGADGFSVKGNVFLDGVAAKGEVRLFGANIGGILSCTGATFENPEGKAFIANGLTTKRSVFLDGVAAKGEVHLLGANIGSNLVCSGATFESPEGDAFNAENASINGTLFFSKIKIDGALNLGHAHVGQLTDDKISWPGQDKLILSGFEYEALAGDDTPKSAEERIDWLRLQPQSPFYTQPYEHLAKVFRQIGHETDARSVLIAKQDDLRKYGALSSWAKLLNGFLGFAVGHGYKPWQVIFRFILPMVIVGLMIFWWADNVNVMQPSKERVYLDKAFIETQELPLRYPVFNPLAYSLDVFVPFLDLHQENYWLPDATRPNGCWFRIYLWLHIALGWIFSTLAAVSLAGLVRKE